MHSSDAASDSHFPQQESETGRDGIHEKRVLRTIPLTLSSRHYRVDGRRLASHTCLRGENCSIQYREKGPLLRPRPTATAASIEFPARTREEDFLVSMATRPLRRKYLSLPRPSRLSAAEEIEGIFHEDGVTPPGHFLVTESVAGLENRVTHLP